MLIFPHNDHQEGVITIGIALLAIFFLPDYPATTRWLSAEEKHFAAWRLLADFDEADLDDEEHHPERGRSMPLEGLRLALRDGRLYLFILLQHVSLLSQTFQYFFPAIVGTLGYGAIDTLWLTAPVWVRSTSKYPLLGYIYTYTNSCVIIAPSGSYSPNPPSSSLPICFSEDN